MQWPHKDAIRVYCQLSYTWPYDRLPSHYTYLWVEPDFTDGLVTIGTTVYSVTMKWGFKIKQ